MNRFFLLIFTFAASLGYSCLSAQSIDIESSLYNSFIEWELREEMKEQIIVLKNDYTHLPIRDIGQSSFAVVGVGSSDLNVFYKASQRYIDPAYFHLDTYTLWSDAQRILPELSSFNSVIWVWKLASDSIPAIVNLLPAQDNYLHIFIDPYSLENGRAILQKSRTFIWVRRQENLAQEIVAQMIFDAEAAQVQMAAFKDKAYLSAALMKELSEGGQEKGPLSWQGGNRLTYTVPEAVGWNGSLLKQKADSIIHRAIREGAFPGCQLLMAVEGKVILHETYGYHTYDSLRAVHWRDVYDLASITKISGPLPLIMKLVGEEKIHLDDPLSLVWEDFDRKDKDALSWRKILAHQSGLEPYFLYWPKTVKKNGNYKKRWYSAEADEEYNLQIQSDLYLKQKFKDKIYKRIRKSEVSAEPTYVYSGLSFLLFPDIIQQLSGKSFERYLYDTIYDPLGASLLRYRPSTFLASRQIVPTEYDSVYRKRLVQGYVHDEAAAMFGGVSGNAGLFSNANDVAKLMQMYVQMGQYAGQAIINEEVMKEFTSYQFRELENRRGLGFDKPMLAEKEKGYISPLAGEQSFGHSGFTGTFAWADPEGERVIILLSNRVYPSRDRRELYSLNVRPSLHSLMYDPTITNAATDKAK